MNAARRVAWAGIEARHGAIPGIAVADKTLTGVTGLRLDATVVACHSEQQGAGPNFKGFGLHLWAAGVTAPASRWPGCCARAPARSNTAADHVKVLGEAIAALPPKYRRRLMVTCDGAGASHDLVAHLDKLARRPGHLLIYSVLARGALVPGQVGGHREPQRVSRGRRAAGRDGG